MYSFLQVQDEVCLRLAILRNNDKEVNDNEDGVTPLKEGNNLNKPVLFYFFIIATFILINTSIYSPYLIF